MNSPKNTSLGNKPVLRVALGLGLLMACLPSCRSYTEKTSRAMALFQSGQFEQAETLFADTEVTGSTFLSGVEAGMTAMTAGEFGRAVDHLTRAADFASEVEDASIANPQSLAQTLTSWAVSETAIDYQGEGYERVMLHACMGLAYLGLGSIDDLLVEVRRANDLLAAEESLYDTKYEAGGFGHFLSALGYELRGEPDQAYIDYLDLYDKGVGGELIGPQLVRLSRDLHRQEDHRQFSQEYGPNVADIPEDAAKIVLIAGVGLGPYKVESRLDVPTSNGVFSWAVPSFFARSNHYGGLEIRAGDLAATTVVLEDVNAVAEKNLADRLAFLSVKSAVRGVLKQKLARELRKEHGEGAYALAQLFSMVTERADTRSWVTLPASWQAARLYPRPGIVGLTLRMPGGDQIDLGTYDMEPGETIFLLARSIGPRVYAQVLGGQRIDPPTPALLTE